MSLETIKDTFQAGSYEISQTRGFNPFVEKYQIEWVLDSADVLPMLDLFKSEMMNGIYDYEHEQLGAMLVRPVGDFSTQEVFAEQEVRVMMSFRRVMA